MSVELTPSSGLGFHRPLTNLVKRTLTVGNPHSQPVIFKVKTTAPKQYCVRPNSGRVEPGERVEVQVLLQPMKEDPPPGAKCRDKFLVQSAYIPSDLSTSGAIAELWQTIERDHKPTISEHKIRCTYLPPLDSMPPVPEGAEDMTMSVGEESKFADSSMFTNGADEEDSRFKTVRSSTSASGMNGSDEGSAPSPPAYDTSATPTNFVADSKAAVVSAVTSASSSAQQTTDEVLTKLRRQLADAQSEVERLRSEAARKAKAAVAQVTPSTQVATHEGVPLQVVIGIVVGVFVFTWLFF